MGKTKKVTEKPPKSIFKKLEIDNINDILTLYLLYDIDQNLINNIAVKCGNFLLQKKKLSQEIVKEFAFRYNFNNHDINQIFVKGGNLLSSLWIMNFFPEKPEELVNGDFTYKFYTKNKNLSITKTKNNNERKFTINS